MGSVGVSRDGRVVAEIGVGVRARQAESLLPSVDFALRAARIERAELDGIVVAGGPGSFTGVRIAAATAKGLVRALDVPLFAYSGLLAQAAAMPLPDRPICALFDARRGEVYAGSYRFPALAAVEVLLEPAVRALDPVLSWMLDVSSPGEPAALFVGEGASRYREQIEAAGGVVAPAYLSTPRAAALLWLQALDPDGGRIADPGAWEPEYLRDSGAERGVRG